TSALTGVRRRGDTRQDCGFGWNRVGKGFRGEPAGAASRQIKRCRREGERIAFRREARHQTSPDERTNERREKRRRRRNRKNAGANHCKDFGGAAVTNFKRRRPASRFRRPSPLPACQHASTRLPAGRRKAGRQALPARTTATWMTARWGRPKRIRV